MQATINGVSTDMPITVELQDMFSYSIIPIIVLALVLAIGIVWVILYLIKKHRKKPKDAVPVPAAPVRTESPEQIKARYLDILNNLEAKFQSGNMSNRKAYQELSKIIRSFVYEVTGIKVHHNTLGEIKRLNMPNLYAVVKECYEPEFSVDKDGYIHDTINKARTVIIEWR